ncbi:MAG: helix-turn-helix transcriptional regulator [Chloroflexota bacterium]
MSTWIDGNKIAVLRKQKQMDQTELANQAGIAQSVVSRMERNMQVDYKLSVVIAVANALDVGIEDIVENNIHLTQEDKLEPELKSLLRELPSLDGKSQRIIAKTMKTLIDALVETS